jgi:methyl-accepting chemotaxis protein-1 (serine sensor receptor)
MMMLSNLKIRTRIALLAAILITAMIAIATQGWIALHKSQSRSTEALRELQILNASVDAARKAQVDFKIQVQEWKNILLRGSDPALFKRHSEGFIKSSEDTRQSLQKLNGLLSSLGLYTSLVDEALKTQDVLKIRYLEALKIHEPSNPRNSQVIDSLVRGIDRDPTKKIDDIVFYVHQQASRLSDELAQEALERHRTASQLMLTIVIGAAIFGILITFWLARSITLPINEAVKVAQTVASGDLTSKIEVHSKDETGQLIRALKDMNDSLIRMVAQIRADAHTISTASSQIASGNQELSSRTEQQASSLEETASSMEELTSTVRQNADNARQASHLATAASEVAIKGGIVVSQVVNTMDAINGSSKKIVDIISVIDGIAFQTNILALNAAVEAARAGEQGRGFAVVASEVRNLAQRSASAAHEIKTLIDDSVEKVESGTRLVGEAGATMDEIVSSIKRVHDIMGEITAASNEQSEGIEQVNQAIVQMDQVTQQNAALVEEAAAAAEALQDQAKDLVEVVRVFRTGEGQSMTAPLLSQQR